MTTIPIDILVTEALSMGKLWIENDRVMVNLPAEAGWLLEELKARRQEALSYCRDRWLRPGVAYSVWLRQQCSDLQSLCRPIVGRDPSHRTHPAGTSL